MSDSQKPRKAEVKYEIDYRKSNPNLHLLYVKTACRNLAELDRCINRLDGLSSVSMLVGPVDALIKERNKLVETDASYADASDIIRAMRESREEDIELKVESQGCEATGTESEIEGDGNRSHHR